MGPFGPLFDPIWTPKWAIMAKSTTCFATGGMRKPVNTPIWAKYPYFGGWPEIGSFLDP